MSQETNVIKDYIGDGVYTIFDGYGIWLHVNNYEDPTDKVYLDPTVLRALINFVKRVEVITCQDIG